MNGAATGATTKPNGSLSFDEEGLKNGVGGNRRRSRRNSFTHSVILESVVIFLIIVSALAITGENLIRFDFITVPKHSSELKTTTDSTRDLSNGSDSNDTASNSPPDGSHITNYELLQVNVQVMDLLEDVFHHSSLGVAAFFCAEIIFKIITLCGEMFAQPWQAFDTIIVVLTMTVELAFHFADLPWIGLYSIKYIVLLRLWRIPFACSIKAQRVQDSLQQDIETCRSGHQKAAEKCVQLELSLSQQAEIIRQLEGALQTFTSERGAASYELNPRELLESSKPSPLPRKIIPGASQLRRSLLRKEPLTVMETEFMSGTDDVASVPGEMTAVGRTATYNVTATHEDDDNGSTAPSPDQGFVSDTVDGEDVFVEESMDTVLDTSQFQLRPNKRVMIGGAVSSPAVGNPASSPRRKTRRSSTSEYLDYAKLSSSSSSLDRAFSRESAESNNRDCNLDSKLEPNGNLSESDLPSPPAGRVGPDGSSHSNSSASDASKPCDTSHDDNAGRFSTQSETFSSGGLSEDSSLNGDGGGTEDPERGHRHKGKKVRRFSSCPEYAYTQRVTITSEESAFIGEDGGSSDEISIHDNLGYVVTEIEALHVLAEFEGSKTYRSEGGIPMTSL